MPSKEVIFGKERAPYGLIRPAITITSQPTGEAKTSPRRHRLVIAFVLAAVLLPVMAIGYSGWQRAGRQSRGVTIKGDISLIYLDSRGYVTGYELGERTLPRGGRFSDDEVDALLSPQASTLETASGSRAVFLAAARWGYREARRDAGRAVPVPRTEDGLMVGWSEGRWQLPFPNPDSIYKAAYARVAWHISHNQGDNLMAYFRAYAENYKRGFAAGVLSRFRFSSANHLRELNDIGPRLQVVAPLAAFPSPPPDV